MKKLISIILLCLCVFSVFTLSSCKKAGGDDAKNDNKKNGGATFTINGVDIELDSESNHYDLYYKENWRELHRETMGSFRNIDYTNDQGERVFDVRLVYFKDKSIDEVMAESDYTYTEKTHNGIKYQYFEYSEGGKPGHTYVYNYNGNTYTISFASAYDMTSLEDVFMSQVYFKTAE